MLSNIIFSPLYDRGINKQQNGQRTAVTREGLMGRRGGRSSPVWDGEFTAHTPHLQAPRSLGAPGREVGTPLSH